MNTLNKIKCFQVIPNLGEGGAEKLALSLADAIDKDKYDVTLVSLYKSQESIYEQLARVKGLKIKFFNKKPGLDLMVIYHLIKYFLKEKPQIIHTHLYSVQYTFLPIILSRVKVRVHTIHSMAGNELGRLYRISLKLFFRYFHFIPIAISEIVRGTIEKEYVITANNIPLIHNAIEIEKYRPISSRKFNNTSVKFCAIGNLGIVKNHIFLINAFQEAYKCNSKISLQIVGDGPLKNHLIDLIEEKGLSSVIKIEGIRSDIPEILEKADVMVMSSLWEGLPLVILEAIAAGLPIISTKVGGIPDVVIEGRNGYLINNEDLSAFTSTMLMLADDINLRKKISGYNLEDAFKYDISLAAKKYEQIYERELYN